MKLSVIFKTKSGNTYLYNDQYQLSGLIHPALNEINDNISESEVDPYYIKKYEYLKKYGFFRQKETTRYESLTTIEIEEGMSQVSKVVFEVTDACNLKCTYCGYGDLYEVFDKRVYHNIDFEYAKKFLDYIFNLKLKSNNPYLMIGFYGGEPLLNMQFIRQIIGYINSLDVKSSINIEYSTTTNATLIHKHIDFLVKNKFYVLISLDGDKVGDSYRVYGDGYKESFPKVIENTDMIQCKYPEYFSKYISFNAVLHNRNSVRSIYDFIYTRYQKIPSISEIISSNIKPEKRNDFNKIYNSLRKSEFDYFSDKDNVLLEARLDSVFYSDLMDFLKYTHVNLYIWNSISLLMKERKFFPSNTCFPFSLKIFLTSHNRLLPCERINHKYYLGEVKDRVEINLEEIVKKYNRYYKRVKALCENCYSYRYCGKCLFQIENIGDPNKTLYCDKFCNQKKFIDKLENIFNFAEQYPEDCIRILEEE